MATGFESVDGQEEAELLLVEEAGSEGGIEIEDISGEDRITSPFDPTLIRVEPRPLTIDLMMARLREDEIDLAPDFQRKAGIWTNQAQSRLIESLLIRIPLPAFYVDATDDERWVVVDGLQRLTTLKRFIVDQSLKLTGLEFLPLDGKSYEDLPRSYQRRILETQITVFAITRGTPDEVKFTIFRRINTGGKPLSAQEIRHALNQGKITRRLAALAKATEFQRAINWGVSDDRMEDRELVLRFLAFALIPPAEYKAQDFDGFLNRAMQRMNQMSDAELDTMEVAFKRAMRAAAAIFEKDAFRKRYAVDQRRKAVNKPLFESWSVNLHRLSDDELTRLIQRKQAIREAFMRLMNDDRRFDDSVSQGTGDVAKVQYRFARIGQLIQEVLA